MKHKDYWRKRFEQLEEAQNNKSVKYYLELEKQYKLAINSIEKDILAWYNRFAKNEGISLLEAKKLLNTRELEEFKWSVEEYIKYGKENAINQKWMKELENASARVHITRLEALKLQIQQQVEVLYGNELDGIDKLMRDIYTSGYYHTAFNVQ
ncbi:TPA: phage head morphogenesis protein, partial [Clostridioides difficile]|nr:phage head morphogenesis protein [Clostridioides difficile]